VFSASTLVSSVSGQKKFAQEPKKNNNKKPGF
jgi:hypothetical protein